MSTEQNLQFKAGELKMPLQYMTHVAILKVLLQSLQTKISDFKPSQKRKWDEKQKVQKAEKLYSHSAPKKYRKNVVSTE